MKNRSQLLTKDFYSYYLLQASTYKWPPWSNELEYAVRYRPPVHLPVRYRLSTKKLIGKKNIPSNYGLCQICKWQLHTRAAMKHCAKWKRQISACGSRCGHILARGWNWKNKLLWTLAKNCFSFLTERKRKWTLPPGEKWWRQRIRQYKSCWRHRKPVLQKMKEKMKCVITFDY